MRWYRLKPGLYGAGRYIVGKVPSGEWFAEGPGIDAVYPSKSAAQEACQQAVMRTTEP